MIKAVEYYDKMVNLNLHVLYLGLTMVHTLIVLYICQQQVVLVCRYHSR